MSNIVLSKDTDLKFPQFVVLRASAGSGKTYALTQRFVQFLLSNKIPKNNLRNILAITFSNNAAKEMRERIIKCLKDLYFKKSPLIDEFTNLVSLNKDLISYKSGTLIDEILGNYSDFHVKTIDSFMTSVFKASAIDFGYNSDFDIVMDNDAFMDYSFNIFLRKVTETSPEARLLQELIEIIGEQKTEGSPFLWDPVPSLLNESKKIYLKISSLGRQIDINDYSHIIKQKVREIQTALEEISKEIEQSGLEKNNNSSFYRILDCVKKGTLADIIGLGLKYLPVKKPTLKAKTEQYNKIGELWQKATQLIKDYIYLFSCSYYAPYLRVYNAFNDIVEQTKRYQGRIFIGDINHYLSSYIRSEIVPDIYFSIGETIYHFLIDEFQDTSPIQWNNILPLISNSLAQDGSLFVVGDTKQAIYGFRDADYRIMKNCETYNPFPSANHMVFELTTNYRSLREILNFNERVFKGNSKYIEAAQRSGLSDYNQKPKRDTEAGYVEVNIYEKDMDLLPEKERLIELIDDIKKRGYSNSDIAILALKNDEVVNITTWLSEHNIDFISLSSLDVRLRKCTIEIISLINFLDSPTDDLSFATFITGEIFTENLALKDIKDANSVIHDFLVSSRGMKPLYKAFQREFMELWDYFFAELFRLIGYLPLYEIVDRIIKTFRLFDIKANEEAVLIKILEIVKDFESKGLNSVKDFLHMTTDDFNDSSLWNIALPSNIDAVKVMTIHKAKGLGFPIVILFLFEDKNKGFGHIIEENQNKIRLLKINKKMADMNDLLEYIYNEERINETVDKLNTLYVGFTRAEKELYVIGVKGKGDSFPFDLIKFNDLPLGQKTKKTSHTKDLFPQELRLFHHNSLITHDVSTERLLLHTEERTRGEFIHEVLSCITYSDQAFGSELHKIINLVIQDTKVAYPLNEIEEMVRRIVNHRTLKDLFIYKPNRKIMNEIDVVSSTGRLFRIDRLIVDEHKITILDYKTGSDLDVKEEHILQVKNYINILKKIFPEGQVTGIIAYIDASNINVVEVR